MRLGRGVEPWGGGLNRDFELCYVGARVSCELGRRGRAARVDRSVAPLRLAAVVLPYAERVGLTGNACRHECPRRCTCVGGVEGGAWGALQRTSADEVLPGRGGVGVYESRGCRFAGVKCAASWMGLAGVYRCRVGPCAQSAVYVHDRIQQCVCGSFAFCTVRERNLEALVRAWRVTTRRR